VNLRILYPRSRLCAFLATIRDVSAWYAQGFAHFYIYLWGYNDDDASPDDVDNGDSRSSGNHAQEDSAHRRLRLFLRDIAEWEKAGYVTVIPWTRQFGGRREHADDNEGGVIIM